MAIDYAAIAAAGGIGKGTPIAARKLRQQRTETAAIRACYQQVDARDGRRCQFPGCRRSMRIHHHLAYRSTADRAIKHTTANVTSVCVQHHSWIHGGLVQVRGNANRRLTWTVTASGREAKVRLPREAA